MQEKLIKEKVLGDDIEKIDIDIEKVKFKIEVSHVLLACTT